MVKGKRDYLGSVSWGFGALRGGAPGLKMVYLGSQDTDCDKDVVTCDFTAGWAHTRHFERGLMKMWLSWERF